MDKRFQEASSSAMVGAIEEMAGRPLSPRLREQVVQGADEVDIVYSGLEETMVVAFDQIVERMFEDQRIETLRTSAFTVAVEKVARAYLELGVFP
jgi:glutamate dehydrogenase (NAD(P)+)